MSSRHQFLRASTWRQKRLDRVTDVNLRIPRRVIRELRLDKVNVKFEFSYGRYWPDKERWMLVKEVRNDSN